MEKTRVVTGERIARDGELRLGCSAVIYDPSGEKFLLTRRADNAQWCLPSGRVEAGESVAEACVREVFEETCLLTRITRLVGIYSDPNKLVIYPDGNKAHIVAIHFEAEIIGGELGGSDETTDWGYFSIQQTENLDMLPGHLERIKDSVSGQSGIIK